MSQPDRPEDIPPRYGPPAYGPPPDWAPPPIDVPPPPPPLLTRVRTRWQQGPVSVAIVALTVGVWLVHEVLITWFGVNTDLSLQDNGSAIHGQPWRLVTPLVVHYQIGGMPSIVHLGLNMWALWIIGPPVEKVIGRRLYAASYLIAGAAGQVASDLYYQWHPLHQNGQVVQLVSGGASGAVFGVVGLLVGDYAVTAWAERHGRASSQEWRFNPSAVRSLAIQGTAWIVLTSVLVPGIDNWAHIGGAATGLLIGGGVAWSRTAPATTPSG